MGTTKRTNEEIEQFNQEFKCKNPKYLCLTVNCQFYVMALVDFTLAKGHRLMFRKLPPPESMGTNLAGSN